MTSDEFNLNEQVKLLYNELERVKNTLDIYKKALKLTARLLCDFEYCGEFCGDCEACACKIAGEYLEKAMKDNDR